ncbi:CheF family chemotaxis protein [Natronomonas salsuginis]|uniref:Taxis protein CheF n=1 Tax=Natronomonas salsuginis TaxID=2217661 RepID=A0A4U5JPZ7_9EURY|nr:CheF family chemotaxis protein [Natronomonas salsuginis]TKR28299.1 fla operon protein [Natronomonas salsuginis]
MSGDERAVADFVGRFVRNPSAGSIEHPETGRIVMSQMRLVIAGDDEKLTTPLSNVVDVVVGNAPPDLRDMFDSAVTVGYRADGDRVETVVIEGGSETIERFRTVLFRCLLGGTKAYIRHPAQVGGRVTDTPIKKAKLSISSDGVAFKTGTATFRIAIENVIGFERADRSIGGGDGPTLLIRHADDGEVTTSLVSPLSTRRLNILGRYLRIEYGTLLSDVAEIDLSESETRLLVAVYATGGDIDFASVLDGDAARATNAVNALREKELIEDGPTGLSLTTHGQVMVNQRLEDVNV